MNSFGDSNSVPVGPPGNTLSTAISVHDSSSSSPPNHDPLRFQVRLYDDYKEQAVFPELADIDGTDRWVTITTQYDRKYKIEMVDDGAQFLLHRGWPILAKVENLQEGQLLMFEKQDENTFRMWIHRPFQHLAPLGFSPARISIPPNSFGPRQLIINSDTQMNESVLQTIQQVWMASLADGPIYVSSLDIIPSGNNILIFDKSYSDLIPKNETDVAMRFIGSSLIIPGSIKTYSSGNTRMVKWSLYAKEHGLASGDIFVCKIHGGPAVREFIGSCVNRN